MGAENLRGMKQEEAKVEYCNEGNMDDIWDIMVKDVESLRQLLTPTIHTFLEPNLVVQPYVPLIPFPNEVKVVRQEEPDNDISSIPTQLLEEFGDKILDITVVDEEDDFNSTKDIEELERLISIDHESSLTKIKAFWCIVTTNVEFEPLI
ncbi:hypothetical protein Tco_1456548 [Tanacetum coccineum]